MNAPTNEGKGTRDPDPAGFPGEDLGVVDWESLQRRMGGYGDLALRVAGVSIGQFPTFLESIPRQLAESDPVAGRTLHSLKGICLNLEARRVSSLLERMEFLVEASLFEEARRLGGRLPAELARIEGEFAKGVPW